jgi:hypothetical protein
VSLQKGEECTAAAEAVSRAEEEAEAQAKQAAEEAAEKKAQAEQEAIEKAEHHARLRDPQIWEMMRDDEQRIEFAKTGLTILERSVSKEHIILFLRLKFQSIMADLGGEVREGRHLCKRPGTSSARTDDDQQYQYVKDRFPRAGNWVTERDGNGIATSGGSNRDSDGILSALRDLALIPNRRGAELIKEFFTLLDDPSYLPESSWTNHPLSAILWILAAGALAWLLVELVKTLIETSTKGEGCGTAAQARVAQPTKARLQGPRSILRAMATLSMMPGVTASGSTATGSPSTSQLAATVAVLLVAVTVATQCYWSYGKLRDDKKDEESRRTSNPRDQGPDALSTEGLTAHRSWDAKDAPPADPATPARLEDCVSGTNGEAADKAVWMSPTQHPGNRVDTTSMEDINTVAGPNSPMEAFWSGLGADGARTLAMLRSALMTANAEQNGCSEVDGSDGGADEAAWMLTRRLDYACGSRITGSLPGKLPYYGTTPITWWQYEQPSSPPLRAIERSSGNPSRTAIGR